GAAARLQRQGHHGARRRHEGHFGHARRAGRPGGSAPRCARPAVPSVVVTVGISEPFGVYIHIPFCRHRCDYCAFATWTDRDHVIDDYLAALRLDISRASLVPVTSAFVGGGTPTRVPAADLAAVLTTIPLIEGAEVTIECNPDDVTVEMMRTYAAAGVNRVSIGVQSMVPSVLASLGRTHVPA